MNRSAEIVREQIKGVVDTLRALDIDEADQAWIDSIEGETELFEVCGRIVARIGDLETHNTAIKERMAGMKARADRFNNQSQSLRGALMTLMDACGQKKLELPEATLSVSQRKPKRVVVDEALIPDAFWKVKREIDKTAINAAEGVVEGTEFDNGGASLTIRRS
jgi:hypothetical protein